jgi:deoxyribodipyrimidine photo-lyase
MIAQRRLVWNFALDRAIAWAEELGKPLVVLEALRCDYRWASDRIHRFVLEGMAENARRAAGKRLLYVPYVEPEVGAGKGLLRALSRRACLIVTDDFPCFFLPRMVAAAASQVECRLESVDGNGLLPLCRRPTPLRRPPTPFAASCRRSCPRHLDSEMPAAAPLDTLALPTLEKLLVREVPSVAGTVRPTNFCPVDAAGRSRRCRSITSVAPGVLRGGSAAAEAQFS